MDNSGVILRAVARPPVLLGASPELAKVSGGVGIFVYLLSLNGFYGAVAFMAAHALAVWLTWRDPDCVAVLRAWARVRRGLGGRPPSFYPTAGHRYVP